MGFIKKVGEIISKGEDLADQAITDKDKLNELKYTLAKAHAELMLGGKGQSVTKITICGLVSVVVGTLTYTFLFDRGNMSDAIMYAQAVTPVIGILTGSYLTGTSFKRSKWSKE